MPRKIDRPIPDFSLSELDGIINKLISEKGIKSEKWSEKDTYLLKKLYGRVPTMEISNLLGRSSNSIQLKALRMNLKFDKCE